MLARLDRLLARPWGFFAAFGVGFAALTWLSLFLNDAPLPGQAWDAARAPFHGRHLHHSDIVQYVAYVYLSALYLFCLARWDRLGLQRRSLERMGLAFALVVALGFPFNSRDLFCYIENGRLLGVYGLNPYHHDYSEIHDWFTPFAWLKRRVSYGPVYIPLMGVAGWLSELGPNWAYLYLKGFALLLYLASCALLPRALASGSLAAPDADRRWFMFAYNPVLVIELLSNGHNDVLIVFFTLLSLYFLGRERLAWSLVFATLAALVKIPMALYGLMLFVYCVRKQAWAAMARWLGFCAGVAVLLRLTLIPDVEALTCITDSSGAWIQWAFRSVYLLLGLDQSMPGVHPDRLALKLTTFAFLPYVLWRAWKVWQEPSVQRVLGESVRCMVWWLAIFGTFHFYPWYVAWYLPLLVVAAYDTTFAEGMLFALVMFFAYVPGTSEFNFGPIYFGFTSREWLALGYLLAVAVLRLRRVNLAASLERQSVVQA